MNLIPYVSTWAILAVAVVIIAVYRVRIARRDDQSLHLMVSDQHVLADQQMAIKKIRSIDHLGQALTVLAITYGLVIVALYLYHIWQEGAKMPQ
jgi:ribonuclease D